MNLIIITVAAFITALLTFFSGFGLGTILTPVFVIFFPIDLAIALTGVVHFFNNLFKLTLIGRSADRSVLLHFGIPAVLAAFVGAWLLLNIAELQPWYSYTLGTHTYQVTPVKFIISLLLILFALMDLIPYFSNLAFKRERLSLGGILSGFFGGLSGNQGVLRSAFLIKAGLSKEAFVATGIVIACFVDFTRLAVYSTRFIASGLSENLTIVVSATVAAIAGAYIGNRLLRKVTLDFIQKLVAVMLVIISLALGAGLI